MTTTETLTQIKGRMVASLGNMEAELQKRRQTVLFVEADLVRARKEVDVTSGAVQAMAQAIAEVDTAIAAEKLGQTPAKK